MRHSTSTELLKPDPEIDRTFKHLLKERRDWEKVMAEKNKRKALRDYIVPALTGAKIPTWRPQWTHLYFS